MMSTIDPNAELFDDGRGGGGGGTLHLSVTDPQQIGEGRNAHTFYRIDVRPNQYADTIASVRRRYSDFRWLFQRLHEERPGAIIPIIPHTKAFQIEKRLSEELIEERRVSLFEQAKKDHPETEGFISEDGTTSSAKEKAKVARGVDLEETPDAAQVDEVEQYLSALETHTYDPDTTTPDDNDSSSSSNNSNAKSKNPSLKTISNIFASLSAINKVKYDDNYAKVSKPIIDIQDNIKAARLALKRRKDHAITYNTFLQQIKNRQAALEKLNHKNATSPQATTENQIVSTQQLLDESNKSSKVALAALEKVTQRVFREMDRFKHSVDAQLRLLYVNHARVQVDYSRQLDVEWNKLLPNGNAGSGGAVNGRVGGSGADDGVLSKEAEMLMI
ncbi:sorting nexin 1 [Skeletonema marinoi]|uniref:Sorting nexin 1 n=1 Tax=Skeletonema marinoi TaxID=267567 RepID=A0AAD8Y579_9STRA|nr:sorting nexin 1 [Skeletonema marinoi]